jgi:hypothetical protein
VQCFFTCPELVVPILLQSRRAYGGCVLNIIQNFNLIMRGQPLVVCMLPFCLPIYFARSGAASLCAHLAGLRFNSLCKHRPLPTKMPASSFAATSIFRSSLTLRSSRRRRGMADSLSQRPRVRALWKLQRWIVTV